MVQFPRNITFDAPHYCRVCRREIGSAKALPGYEGELDYVCESCYNRFFGEIGRIERQPADVLFRPADIKEDEYRPPDIFPHEIIRSTGIWIAAGAVMYAGILLTDTVYGACAGDIHALPALIVYSVLSFTVGTQALIRLIGGIFRGMDIKRRLLLGLKVLICCGAAALSAAGAVSVLAGAAGVIG